MLENSITAIESMGFPLNDSFEYFERNSTIHQSFVVEP
jgi:exonuclease VII small subunit